MRKRWLRALVIVMAMIGGAVVISAPSVARAAQTDGLGWVTLTLRDGREFTGEIIEETQHKITIEYYVGGITARHSFAAFDVVEVERHAAPDGAVPRQRDGAPAPDAAITEQGGYVLVPTRGVFGKEVSTFLFREAIETSIERGAEAVIFELESPGGYLFGLHQIYEVIQTHRDEIKIVFYVNGNCFSAAALVCLAADHFYAGPKTAFGAAVVIRSNAAGGHQAVEQKFAAAEAAIWRQRVEEAGHLSILVDPLMIMEAELWADTSTTPWTLYKNEPRNLGEGVEIVRIDSNQTVLGATQQELLQIGAVDGVADTFRDVLRQLDLDNPAHEAYDGAKLADTVERRQKRNLRDIDNRVNNIESTIAAIQEAETITQFRRQIRSIKGSLDRIRRMMEELDYIEFHCRVERGITDELLDEWDAVITSVLKEIETR